MARDGAGAAVTRDWMAGSVVDNDREESRSARDKPLPQHREHPLDCACFGCMRDNYEPGDGQ